MRQIKFRVWDGEQMVSPDYIDRAGQAWWTEHSIPRHSEKVMQFTGLHDKNGKEIYEGDIVKISYSIPEDEDGNELPRRYAIGFVSWDEHSTGWIIRTKSPMYVNGDGTVITSIIHGHFGEREIIGNIHENPELLK